MHIAVRFACCFQHAAGALKADIGDLIEPVRPELWTVARDRMLLPLLHRLSDFDARMPRQWIANPPTKCPPNPENDDPLRTKTLIQIRFWTLCKLARADTPEPYLFQTVFSLADAILIIIVKVEGNRPVHPRLWTQISLAANVDPIFQAVLRVAGSTHLKDRSHTAERLAQCGALDYALVLAMRMEARRPRVLDAFVRQLKDIVDRQNQMRLVLAVSLKDPNSCLYALGPDLLRMVVHTTNEPELIMWEDVLKEHVAHDELVLV